MTTAVVLLLADSRLPAGGHAHSGGVEAAAASGRVRDVASLAGFLRGRLATVGVVAAAFAAAACAHRGGRWVELDGEFDARTPVPALRVASRAQGRALLRAGRAGWPGPLLDGLASALPDGPHHPVALGACMAAAGGSPRDAAAVAAYGTITGPASAAVRLLGLDPLAVHRVLAGLGAEIDAVAAGIDPELPWAALPAWSAPALDVLGQLHQRSEVRLFES